MAHDVQFSIPTRDLGPGRYHFSSKAYGAYSAPSKSRRVR